MAGAAILGALDVVAPRDGRFEPDVGLTPRDDILLDAESRHVKAVQDVAQRRVQVQPDILSLGHVELRGDLAVGIGERPRPPFAQHLNIERILGHRPHLPEGAVAVIEDDEEQDRRDHRPGYLQRQIVLDVADLRGPDAAVVVAEDEIGHEPHHQCKHRPGDAGRDPKRPVDVGGVGRSVPAESFKHPLSPL